MGLASLLAWTSHVVNQYLVTMTSHHTQKEEAFVIMCAYVLKRPGPNWHQQVLSPFGLTVFSKVVDGQARDLTEKLTKVTFLGILEAFHPNSHAWGLSLKLLPHSSPTQHQLGVQVIFRFSKFLISALCGLCFSYLPIMTESLSLSLFIPNLNPSWIWSPCLPSLIARIHNISTHLASLASLFFKICNGWKNSPKQLPPTTIFMHFSSWFVWSLNVLLCCLTQSPPDLPQIILLSPCKTCLVVSLRALLWLQSSLIQCLYNVCLPWVCSSCHLLLPPWGAHPGPLGKVVYPAPRSRNPLLRL